MKNNEKIYTGDSNTFILFNKNYTNRTSPVRSQLKNDVTATYQELYLMMMEHGIHTVFPNVEVSLLIFLTLMVSNCAAERSFSRLKHIKSAIRTTLNQEKLSCFAIMCIEADKLREMSFEILIDNFSKMKSRKAFF